MDALIELLEKTDKADILHKQIHESLFILFAHNGIYHSTSGEKLPLPLELDTLMVYAENGWYFSKPTAD